MLLMRSPLLSCAGVLLAPAIAAAQAECPPGDWFCEPSPPPAAVPQRPAPPPESNPGRPPPVERSHAPTWEPSSHMDLTAPPPPPPEERVRVRPWALRSQLLLPLVGSGAASNYFMGGVGLGGRARPDPAVAVDLTLDALTGIDYVGHRRDELGVNLATSVFFNPHDPLQAFFVAGLGWSRANTSYDSGATKIENTYHYFGMFAGLGVEWHVKARFSLDLAFLGLLRNRTDSDADSHPEYVDPNTKLVTNSSGAGLARLGLIYYF
jgi:hypothetical protein